MVPMLELVILEPLKLKLKSFRQSTVVDVYPPLSVGLSNFTITADPSAVKVALTMEGGGGNDTGESTSNEGNTFMVCLVG